jgi:hypothetical protein
MLESSVAKLCIASGACCVKRAVVLHSRNFLVFACVKTARLMHGFYQSLSLLFQQVNPCNISVNFNLSPLSTPLITTPTNSNILTILRSPA